MFWGQIKLAASSQVIHLPDDELELDMFFLNRTSGLVRALELGTIKVYHDGSLSLYNYPKAV